MITGASSLGRRGPISHQNTLRTSSMQRKTIDGRAVYPALGRGEYPRISRPVNIVGSRLSLRLSASLLVFSGAESGTGSDRRCSGAMAEEVGARAGQSRVVSPENEGHAGYQNRDDGQPL